jgi:hypothetical protein
LSTDVELSSPPEKSSWIKGKATGRSEATAARRSASRLRERQEHAGRRLAGPRLTRYKHRGPTRLSRTHAENRAGRGQSIPRRADRGRSVARYTHARNETDHAQPIVPHTHSPCIASSIHRPQCLSLRQPARALLSLHLSNPLATTPIPVADSRPASLLERPASGGESCGRGPCRAPLAPLRRGAARRPAPGRAPLCPPAPRHLARPPARPPAWPVRYVGAPRPRQPGARAQAGLGAQPPQSQPQPSSVVLVWS